MSKANIVNPVRTIAGGEIGDAEVKLAVIVPGPVIFTLVGLLVR
jgi:hypothetical protein